MKKEEGAPKQVEFPEEEALDDEPTSEIGQGEKRKEKKIHIDKNEVTFTLSGQHPYPLGLPRLQGEGRRRTQYYDHSERSLAS